MSDNTKALQLPESTMHAPLRGMQLSTLADLRTFAELVIAAGMVPKGGDARETIAKTMLQIEWGAEQGIPPLVTIAGTSVINGIVGYKVHLMAAKVRASGKYDFTVPIYTKERVKVLWLKHGQPIPDGNGGQAKSEWTIERAHEAGYAKRNPNYQKIPREMLYARCISEGAKKYCSDAIGGVFYTVEELVDMKLEKQERSQRHLQPVDITPEPTAPPTDLARLLEDAKRVGMEITDPAIKETLRKAYKAKDADALRAALELTKTDDLIPPDRGDDEPPPVDDDPVMFADDEPPTIAPTGQATLDLKPAKKPRENPAETKRALDKQLNKMTEIFAKDARDPGQEG
jgi:hypothetical protein